MDFVLDGYCGTHCGACPIMLNTKAGKGTERCHGCKSEQPTGYCATCRIKACAQSKGYEFCYQCSDSSACELFQKFITEAKWPVLKNMEMIRSEGKAKWLEAQDKRWRCANCGLSYSWYHETCPQCAQAVASYKANL
jgi:hypothetical protein